MRVWVAGSRSIWCGGTKSSYTRSLEAMDHPLLASLLPPDSEMVDERELKKNPRKVWERSMHGTVVLLS